jgi:hypothetical protein
MARITKAELDNRVTQVTDLLLKGAKRAQILQFAGKLNWDVSDSMVDKYIGQATEAIRESAVVDRDYEVALAKERYESPMLTAPDEAPARIHAGEVCIDQLAGSHQPARRVSPDYRLPSDNTP